MINSKSLLDIMILLTTPWLFGRIWKNFPTLSDNIIMIYRDYRWSYLHLYKSSSLFFFLFSSYHLSSKNPNRSSKPFQFCKTKKKLQTPHPLTNSTSPCASPPRSHCGEAKRVKHRRWFLGEKTLACKSPSIAFEALPLASVHCWYPPEQNTCDDFWSHGHAKK